MPTFTNFYLETDLPKYMSTIFPLGKVCVVLSAVSAYLALWYPFCSPYPKKNKVRIIK